MVGTEDGNINSIFWGIHTKSEGLFLEKKCIAIDFPELDDLSTLPENKDTFKEYFSEIHPELSKNSIGNYTGMIYRFVHEAKIGDYVIYYYKPEKKVYIGKITSEYRFDKNRETYAHLRSVEWEKHCDSLQITNGAMSELGSATTFFGVKNYASEFQSILTGKKLPTVAEDSIEVTNATSEEIKDSTSDFVLKQLNKFFKGYPLENFCSNLLNVMGYRTKVSKHGGDHSIDIIAYKDEFPPRLVVQVKSEKGDIPESYLQTLNGALSPGDYGVFITLSKFTKNAKKFLEDHPCIKGIDGRDLVELILKYYDKLSDENKNLIPLEKVYIPKTILDSDNL